MIIRQIAQGACDLVNTTQIFSKLPRQSLISQTSRWRGSLQQAISQPNTPLPASGYPNKADAAEQFRSTPRWREMDSCQVVFFGLLQVLCSEAEGAVLHPVAYDLVPGARAMGSRERNA